jgi:hypothetical protein
MGRIFFRYNPGAECVRFDATGISEFTFEVPIDSSLPAQEALLLFVPELAKKDVEDAEGTAVGTVRPSSDRSFKITAHKVDGVWKLGPRPSDGSLRKKHGLQGPIDDAFLDSFIFVRPTGKAWNDMVGKWSDAELTRAIEHWRRQFRGNARVKNDVDVTQQDMESSNVVLWGDPGSNAVLAKIADKLPIKWTKESISLAGNNSGKERKFSADNHALIAIYPNPLFPYRYVVLNSSFTYRDFAYLNNARQVPMLPDWAVVDLTTPPNSVWPGKIADADFFDERWQLKPPHAE